MNWKIANAKKKFSDLIRNARKEPQIIYNRNTEVAAIISPDEYRKYKAFREEKENESLATIFKELRLICDEEDYSIVVPERSNREVFV